MRLKHSFQVVRKELYFFLVPLDTVFPPLYFKSDTGTQGRFNRMVALSIKRNLYPRSFMLVEEY